MPLRAARDRTPAWIAAGPVAVLVSWVALVFVPIEYRTQVLYGAIALLSVAAFAVAFHLSTRTDLRRARMELRRARTARLAAVPDGPVTDAQSSPDAGAAYADGGKLCRNVYGVDED